MLPPMLWKLFVFAAGMTAVLIAALALIDPPDSVRRPIALLYVAAWVVLAVRFNTLWHRKQLRARRREEGLCRSCGYDLRATPERCPECGVIPSAARTGSPAD